MYKNYKVVVNTAAGRRRYLKLLIPQVLNSDIVDRYDLWVNTTDKLDIAFLETLAKSFPKINLIWQPDNIVNGVKSINAFYKFCQDEDTIYIKLDDDVVWIAPNFFEEILAFRISNPEYFLVSPLVINNDISTYLLQNSGKLKLTEYFECTSYNIKNYNGYFALQLHEWFLKNYLIPGKVDELYLGKKQIALNRFAINAVAWFGKDLKCIKGVVEDDDEEFLTVIYPAIKNLLNCYYCNTVISHFSFSLQRKIMDQSNILSCYEKYLNESADIQLQHNLAFINNILSNVEKNKEQILSQPLSHPYTQIINSGESKYNVVLKLLGFDASHREPLIDIIRKVKKLNRKYIL